LTGLTKTVPQTALDSELTEHLGHDKHDPAAGTWGNSGNGTRPKTVLTQIGPVALEVPPKRDASFEWSCARAGAASRGSIRSCCRWPPRGLTSGEIAAHFGEVSGAKVGRETITKITDKGVEEMTQWRNRPLDRGYPALFIDAIMVKVRDGQVLDRPV
jgi:putative transposase